MWQDVSEFERRRKSSNVNVTAFIFGSNATQGDGSVAQSLEISSLLYSAFPVRLERTFAITEVEFSLKGDDFKSHVLSRA